MRPPVRDKSPSSLADAFRTCWNAKEGEEGVGGRKAGGKSLAVRRVCVCVRACGRKTGGKWNESEGLRIA